MTGNLHQLAAGPSARRVEVSAPPTRDEVLTVLGAVLWLCSHSRLHVHYSVGMLKDRILPSLSLGQFRFYADAEGAPVGFCNWVWVSPDVLAELIKLGRELAPDEFNCGELPFMYEVLAPFGHARVVMRDLRGSPEFRGRRVPGLRHKVDEHGRRSVRVAHLHFWSGRL